MGAAERSLRTMVPGRALAMSTPDETSTTGHTPAYRRVEQLLAAERCVILDGGVATELQRLRPLEGEASPGRELWGTWALYRAPHGVVSGAASTSRISSSVSKRKLQSQGVHHITINGADRQTAIDFWEGVLGMPFVFEQPNLDNASESHLYFDPGDGRLITVFTNEERTPDPNPTPREPGFVHHLAFSLSQATFHQAVERLDERGVQHSGVKDRGFMDSIYFEDPLGLLIELASYRFEPPFGYTHADVLLEAHKIRVERGDYSIAEDHLADAVETLVTRSRASLSDDRSPKDPYS